MTNKTMTKGAIGFFKLSPFSELRVSAALSLETVMHKIPKYEMRPPPWPENKHVEIVASIDNQCLGLRAFG